MPPEFPADVEVVPGLAEGALAAWTRATPPRTTGWRRRRRRGRSAAAT
jgi:hypothetical protein